MPSFPSNSSVRARAYKALYEPNSRTGKSTKFSTIWYLFLVYANDGWQNIETGFNVLSANNYDLAALNSLQATVH